MVTKLIAIAALCLLAAFASQGLMAAPAVSANLQPRSTLNGVSLPEGAAGTPLPLMPGGHLSLSAPTAVAARGHDLFVVDAGLAAVLRIDTLMETAVVLPGLPSRLGVKLHVMSDRSLLVLDPGSRRVLHYSRDGALINTYRDDINLSRPVAVAVDERRGLVLVADSLQNFIVAFHLSGSASSIIVPGGGDADADRSLSLSAMAVANDGIYVLDRVARQVLHLATDGRIIEAFGAGVLQRPVAIAADDRGRIVVADAQTTSLKIFSAGEMIEEVKDSGLAQGPWQDIADIYADDLNNLYVAERSASRIDVLRFTAPKTKP
jgi:DNA-binding beta-propeller fold protein YncE